MKKPLVSVKMITYNHAAHIRQAIEGVLYQERDFDLELVIGEDCSTDGTREIVFEYQKKFPNLVRIVTSNKNVGMKKNGYRTIRACEGKYIAFCEGDDYWHNPSKLRKQIEHLEKNENCGLVFSSYDVFHLKSGKKIEDFIKFKNWDMPEILSLEEFIESKNGRSLGVLTCTILTRTNLCKKIIEADSFLHKSDHFLMGDSQLWAEIAAVSPMHYINESFATHKIMEESASQSNDKIKGLRFSASNAELFLYLCKKYNLSEDIRTGYEKYWLNSTSRLAYYSKDEVLAEKVKNFTKKMSFKQKIQYYGAKNNIIFHLSRPFVEIKNFIVPDKEQWL